MNKKLLILAGIALMNVLTASSVEAQVNFINANNRLNTPAFHSGCPVTVIDWNNDGLDDIVRLSQGRAAFVEIQKTNQTYETISLGSFSNNSGWAWGMCVADLDHNGFKDIIAGGNSSGVKVLMVNNAGTAGTITTLPNSNFFLQNATAGDFNNDGWADVFLCDDNGPSRIYLNDGTGNLVASSIINFTINPGNIGNDPKDSGNYGSVFTDFDNDGDLDLYIAKCRQSSTQSDGSDPRRVNVMFVNNGDGTYTENAAEYGINIAWQTWTASFGDIDNDADLDLLLTNHDFVSQIFENDGTGHYTDITTLTGFDINDITPIQSGFEDFDNDGFVDIFITGSDSRYFHNNGDKTFTKVEGLFNSNNMESFAMGDLNHDGRVDIYASYANIYTTPTNVDDVVWLNNSSQNNHFFTLDLRGTISNQGAIGARAMIYGAWGVQMREIRVGESYGTVYSSQLHFGLGSATSIDSVVISWPSGGTQTIENPAIDQFLTVKEGVCVSPQVAITGSGPLVLCPGNTLTLNATEGYSYLWSTDETTSSISVNAAGDYGVMVTEAGNDCPATTRTVVIELSPDETPTIEALSETEFCAGQSVELISPAGLTGYTWSNGEIGQSLTVTESGSYALTIQGACAEFTSAPINVVVYAATDPLVEGALIFEPTSAVLTGSGDSLTWYDAIGGNMLASGNVYTTPVLDATTTYFVTNTISYGGGIFNGGLAAPSGNSQYSGDNNTNATTIFSVQNACKLASVVVHTDTPGERKIELRNEAGDLLNSVTINITGIQTIALNFDLLPGVNYTLGTDEATNLLIPNWNLPSPRLKRNNQVNVNYPYVIDDLITIETSSFGNQYYYYFYDWKIEQTPTYCEGSPVAVTVTYEDATSVNDFANQVKVYPNPAKETLTVLTGDANAQATILDATGRVVLNQPVGTASNIAIDNLATGIYFVRVSTSASWFVKKLIKE
jgi:hypothetical protein